MGKIIGNKVKFCMESYMIWEYLPQDLKTIVDNNDIYIRNEDEEGTGLGYEIFIPYLDMYIDIDIVTNYLIYKDEIKSKDGLNDYIENIYLASDFDDLDDFIKEHYANFDFKSCITNFDEIIASTREQLKGIG